MAEEYRSKGLVVIGVSDEDFDLIDEYVADKGVEFPVARLASGEFERAVDVKGFPTSAILNPKGELAWTGHPAEADSVLGEHLKGSKRTPLLPKELSAIEKLLDKEDYSGAFQALNDVLSEEPEQDVRGAAEALVKYIEGRAARLWNKGSGAAAESDYHTAVRAYSELADAYEGIGSSAEAAAKLAEWKKDGDVQKEIKAGEKLAEVPALIDEMDYDKAYKTCRAVGSKFKGTRTAERALERAEELKTSGMLGFDKNCTQCRTERKACERHAK